MLNQFVTWNKIANFVNADFSKLNNTVGVYIIYGSSTKIIRVGQGTVGERLKAHQGEHEIIKHNTWMQPLGAVWASVERSKLNGVETYLGNHYKPCVGDRFPDVPEISVNLPVFY